MLGSALALVVGFALGVGVSALKRKKRGQSSFASKAPLFGHASAAPSKNELSPQSPDAAIDDPSNVVDTRLLVESAVSGDEENLESSAQHASRILLCVRGECLEVSDSFCELVGYERRQLIGMPIESLHGLGMIDLPKNLGFVLHFATLRGVWILLHRNGTRLLVRYQAKLLIDLRIDIRLEPIEL
jgi:hypothetical protein